MLTAIGTNKIAAVYTISDAVMLTTIGTNKIAAIYTIRENAIILTTTDIYKKNISALMLLFYTVIPVQVRFVNCVQHTCVCRHLCRRLHLPEQNSTLNIYSHCSYCLKKPHTKSVVRL